MRDDLIADIVIHDIVKRLSLFASREDVIVFTFHLTISFIRCFFTLKFFYIIRTKMFLNKRD